MKKVYMLFAAILLAGGSFAQFSYGIQGIGNLGNATLSIEELTGATKKAQLHPAGGVVLQYAFNEKFEISSGLNFLQHGIKLKIDQASTGGDDPSIKATYFTRLNYLQLPINLVYTKILSGTQLYAGGGGFLNYGVGGKTTMEREFTSPLGSEKVSEKVKSFESTDDNDGFKKADVGVGALAGLKFGNGLFAQVGYQHSLTNIAPKADDNKYKNRGLQLSVGFMF